MSKLPEKFQPDPESKLPLKKQWEGYVESYKNNSEELQTKRSEIDSIKNRPGIIATRDNPKLVQKWKPVLEKYGITDEYKLKWMAQYCETHIKYEMELQRLGISPISQEILDLAGQTAVDAEFTVINDEVKPSLLKRIIAMIKCMFKIKKRTK